MLFCRKNGRKKRQEHAAQSIRKREWMLFCRIKDKKRKGPTFNRLERKEERRGDLLQNRGKEERRAYLLQIKEGIKEWRPSAE